MRRLGGFLPDAMANGEVLRAAKAKKSLRVWDQIVGEQLAARSWPDRYDRGTVWVAVTGSAWAQELRLRKDTIIARLCEHAGDRTLFVDVRFGVRRLPERDSEPTEAPPVVEKPSGSIRDIAARRLAEWAARDSSGD